MESGLTWLDMLSKNSQKRLLTLRQEFTGSSGRSGATPRRVPEFERRCGDVNFRGWSLFCLRALWRRHGKGAQKRSGRVGMKKHRGLAKCRSAFGHGKAGLPPAYASGRVRACGSLLHPSGSLGEQDAFRIDRFSLKRDGMAPSFQDGRSKALRPREPRRLSELCFFAGSSLKTAWVLLPPSRSAASCGRGEAAYTGRQEASPCGLV